MFVYLKLGEDVRLIPGICLHEGYLPIVGTVGGDLQLEPAIWFKSFIIDSVLIDCDKKILKWCKDPGRSDIFSTEMRLRLATDQQLELMSLPNTVFDNDDCTSFEAEEVEDLFESATKIIQENNSSNYGPPSCISQVESPDEPHTYSKKICEEILRLVHCFVLPAIPLLAEDLPDLKNAQIFIETCKENIEMEISRTDKAISLTETSLVKQRDSLVHDQNFESEDYIRSCNHEFLINFLRDIEKDISDEHDKLEQFQSEVDKLRDSRIEKDMITLTVLRRERDGTLKKFENLCTIRENIKNAVVRPHQRVPRKSTKKTSKVFHEIYLEITHRLRREKESIHKLCLRKLKISSVREAIIIAIEELKSLGESSGWQYDGTRLATDVLAPDSKPKHWLSLGECVAEIIYENTSKPFKTHSSFCDTICEKIDGSLADITFFTDVTVKENSSSSTTNTGDDFVEISVSRQSSLQYDPVEQDHSNVVRPQTSSDLIEPMSSTLPVHALTESVRSEIKKHIEMMCTYLYQALQSSDNPDVVAGKGKKENFKKIWLCYEPYLYDKLKSRLNKLYEMTYHKKAFTLAEKLSSWTMSDLGIDEPWLTGKRQTDETSVKQPLYNNHQAAMPRSCPTPRRQSSISMAISKMSLDDLYNMANVDCVEIPQFFGSVFDPDDTNPKMLVSDSDRDDEDEDDHLRLDESANYLPPPYVSLSDTGESNNHLPPYVTSDEDDQQPPPYHTEDFKQVPVLESFKLVYDYIRDSLQTGSVVGKIKNITKAFHFVNKKLAEHRGQETKGDSPYMPCCDEILTVLILILTKLTPQAFTRLYAHLNMMIDLMPPFIIGSVHDCSLTNFHSAFQYLFDRSLLQNSRDSETLMYGRISFHR